MDFYSEVLIVTGGAAIGGMNRSVELLNLDGSHICNLPPLPNSWVDQERRGKADFYMDHTQTGLVTCGGGGPTPFRRRESTIAAGPLRRVSCCWVALHLNLAGHTLQLKY